MYAALTRRGGLGTAAASIHCTSIVGLLQFVPRELARAQSKKERLFSVYKEHLVVIAILSFGRVWLGKANYYLFETFLRPSPPTHRTAVPFQHQTTASEVLQQTKIIKYELLMSWVQTGGTFEIHCAWLRRTAGILRDSSRSEEKP
eukprot:scaffold175_cov177-Amphora_coffeaeformis.AAC.10